ncbi:hypothetical protein ALC60_02116 [Trachymyrmex zeteki]|uniref:Myb/SANT-like DNA-binding domain-containing protein n=1 Tax=Mycetomoellerius zeteki TaxID=64791 RepID=A0A151XEX0_9HYME|nr:hypothetical protein ALC60_02116 [Trachymyrmex zeteki]
MLNPSGTSCKAIWTHKSTLLFIDLYNKYETQFTSTMIKAEAVWKKIAAEMKTAGYEFSSGQCKDKMKYMKRCYLKKIDHMRSKSTGSAPIKCEYFDELDNLFGKKPNIKPVSVCSTSKVKCQNETIEIEEDVENIDVKEEKTLGKKTRKRKSTSDDLLAKLNSREEAKERRHLEKQAIQRESITVFKNVMNELLKKL